MIKILITGGSGLVGQTLYKLLKNKNYEIVILSRNPKKENEYKWDIAKNYIDKKVFINLDYIIHLAGAGIAEKRWTSKRKKLIIDSRVKTANLLYKKIKELNVNLKGFISASGIGYYGMQTSTKIMTELNTAGNDFLSDVCQKWENAAHQFNTNKTNVTILRTGIVLTNKGGALQKMKTPIILPLGSGKQYLPWIHINDLCNMYAFVIEQNLTGIYNAISGEHITNKIFSKQFAKAVKHPFLNINVPSFILQVMLGNLSKMLLKGSKVSSKKIEKSGFSFQFKNLEKTLINLFKS